MIEKNNNKIKGFFIEIPWSFEILFIPKITLSQNGIDLILKSDLTALICFSDAEFSLIIYMMHIMSVKYFFGGWMDDWNLPF